MAILELQRIDELDDLETGWNRLLSRCLDNHPFLTYEWLTSWWKHFGKGRELKLFTAESEGAVSLAIPVMYSTCRAFGLRRRKAEFVGAPDSDYQVFLVTSFQEAARTVNRLMESIMEDSSDVDSVVFREVPEDSVTARLLGKVNGECLRASRSVVSSCPHVPLPNNYEIYLQTLGPNMRRNLKVWERQALKDYRVEFVTYDKIGTIKEAMKIFFELHQKSQMAKDNCGLFSDGAKRSFHMDVANAFAEKGWLALFFLTFNDKPVSTVYSYEYNGKLYAYLCGFDPEYARYRPGHLAFKNLIKYGINKKLKEFDFLRGNEEYKTRWRTMIRNNFEFRIPKRGFKSKIYNLTTNAFSNLYGVRALSQNFLQRFSKMLSDTNVAEKVGKSAYECSENG
jgi:CelD/BcsL family acetyltransferase involved in cellulose biosynthesis